MMPRPSAQATPEQQADDGGPGLTSSVPPPRRRLFDAAELTRPADPAGPAVWEDPASQAASAATASDPGANAETPVRAPRSASAPERAYVTARGAVVGMSGLFFACNLIDGWTGLVVLAGLGYVAGCVLAPYFVRQNALPLVVAAPPAIFLAALIAAQVLTAQGSGRHGEILSVLEGTLLTLAALAPWLLAGTALGVCVAIPRGLVRCVRDVLTERREDITQRRPWAPKPR
jgi:hypothetical protein